MQTLIVKTDPDVKEGITRFAAELGMPVSVLVNISLKNLIREKQINLSLPYKMTPYLEKVIAKVERDRKKGLNMAGPFKTVAEMRSYLES